MMMDDAGPSTFHVGRAMREQNEYGVFDHEDHGV